MSSSTGNRAARAAFGRRQLLCGGGLTLAGLALAPRGATAGAAPEISRNAECIHQEPTFTAARRRVYQALTDTAQFDRVIRASGALKDLAGTNEATRISPDVGGSFVLFGGYITGRHIELIPDELIVQAWRAGSWGAGLYSIARFELLDAAPGTKILFDHTAFPAGAAEHLAAGWHANYWAPLRKVLA